MFEKILDWKLLSGSHDFPGPDGGTCINEAAIVAAGFEYRAISSAADCPPCFSRVIAAYAIRLNDSMTSALRQELLMPFVTRLAGTADAENENVRSEYLAVQTVKRILPVALRANGLIEHAKNCEAAETAGEANAAADAAAYAAVYAAYAADATADAAVYATADAAANAAKAAANAADAAANAAAWAAANAAAWAAANAAYAAEAAAYAAVYAAYAANAAAKAVANAADAAADAAAWAAANDANDAYAAADAARRQIFTIAVAILDEAIRLGKEGDTISEALIVERMNAMKRMALERV
jgi:hypothetical protein